MLRNSSILSRTTVLLLLISIVATSCTPRIFARPAGEEVGSCTGTMRLKSGGQSRFVLKLYRDKDADENQFKLYFSLPGKTGLLPVEDLEFDDDTVRVVAGKKSLRTYEGTIALKPLKFKGSMDGFSGAFTLDLKEFIDK